MFDRKISFFVLAAFLAAATIIIQHKGGGRFLSGSIFPPHRAGASDSDYHPSSPQLNALLNPHDPLDAANGSLPSGVNPQDLFLTLGVGKDLDDSDPVSDALRRDFESKGGTYVDGLEGSGYLSPSTDNPKPRIMILRDPGDEGVIPLEQLVFHKNAGLLQYALAFGWNTYPALGGRSHPLDELVDVLEDRQKTFTFMDEDGRLDPAKATTVLMLDAFQNYHDARNGQTAGYPAIAQINSYAFYRAMVQAAIQRRQCSDILTQQQLQDLNYLHAVNAAELIKGLVIDQAIWAYSDQTAKGSPKKQAYIRSAEFQIVESEVRYALFRQFHRDFIAALERDASASVWATATTIADGIMNANPKPVTIASAADFQKALQNPWGVAALTIFKPVNTADQGELYSDFDNFGQFLRANLVTLVGFDDAIRLPKTVGSMLSLTYFNVSANGLYGSGLASLPDTCTPFTEDVSTLKAPQNLLTSIDQTPETGSATQTLLDFSGNQLANLPNLQSLNRNFSAYPAGSHITINLENNGIIAAPIDMLEEMADFPGALLIKMTGNPLCGKARNAGSTTDATIPIQERKDFFAALDKINKRRNNIRPPITLECPDFQWTSQTVPTKRCIVNGKLDPGEECDPTVGTWSSGPHCPDPTDPSLNNPTSLRGYKRDTCDGSCNMHPYFCPGPYQGQARDLWKRSYWWGENCKLASETPNSCRYFGGFLEDKVLDPVPSGSVKQLNGTIGCSADYAIDISTCTLTVRTPVGGNSACGNKRVDIGEWCDPSTDWTLWPISKYTCTDLGYDSDQRPGCTNQCTVDVGPCGHAAPNPLQASLMPSMRIANAGDTLLTLAASTPNNASTANSWVDRDNSRRIRAHARDQRALDRADRASQGQAQLAGIPARAQARKKRLAEIAAEVQALTSACHDPRAWTIDDVVNKRVSPTQVCTLNAAGNLNPQASLDDTFASLTNLETADLSSNALTTISQKIPGLRMIKALNLSENRLSSIPAGLGSLTNLSRLDLANNDIASFDPNILKGLNGLVSLDLSNNRLTTIDSSVNALQGLGMLNLAENNIASMPSIDLPNLKVLDLTGNAIAQFPSSLLSAATRQSLSLLILSGNPVQAKDIDQLRNDLKGTKITVVVNGVSVCRNKNWYSSVDAALAANGSACRLDLHGQGMDNFPPAYQNLLPLSNLHSLNLTRNNLAFGVFFVDFSRMGSLTTLNASANGFSSPNSTSYIAPLMGQLRRLIMAHTQLQPASFQIPPYTGTQNQFGNLSELRMLDLSSNSLDDRTPVPPGLTALNMSSDGLGRLPGALAHNAQLTDLDVSYNTLTDLSPILLLKNTLTRLGAGGNQLTGIPANIGALASLEELDLSRNQLSNNIQPIMGLRNLRKLSLASNNISALPATLGQLSSNLLQLDLRDNQLSADALGSIGQLANLRSLNLCNNQLSRIPDSLRSLKKLSYLCLTGNALSMAAIGDLQSALPNTFIDFFDAQSWRAGERQAIADEETSDANLAKSIQDQSQKDNVEQQNDALEQQKDDAEFNQDLNDRGKQRQQAFDAENTALQQQITTYQQRQDAQEAEATAVLQNLPQLPPDDKPPSVVDPDIAEQKADQDALNKIQADLDARDAQLKQEIDQDKSEADAWGYCGDGKVNSNEQCDGKDLGGKTCSDLDPTTTGTPGCGADCTFDASKCTASPSPQMPTVIHDDFNRADAITCSLGQATTDDTPPGLWSYMPLRGDGFAGPVIANNALKNPGLDFAGVVLTQDTKVCSTAVSKALWKDVAISVDLTVPRNATGLPSLAGPFFRSGMLTNGSWILGGYWVRLSSDGIITVYLMSASPALIASSPAITGFDASVAHHLTVLAQGSYINVYLDGNRVFTNALNVGFVSDGSIGIGFGPATAAGRGSVGAQTADNLRVTQINANACNVSLGMDPCINGLTCILPAGGPTDALGVCGNAPPQKKPCFSNQDCSTNQQCNVTASLCITTPCAGICVDQPTLPQGSCRTDADCAATEQCQQPTECAPKPGQNTCYGTCIKKPSTPVSTPSQTLSTVFSDSFQRADAGACALGQADNAFGGGAAPYFYIPTFPLGGTDPTHPIGATITGGALQNFGKDFGGVAFATSDNSCSNVSIRGEEIGNDLQIETELTVPTDSAGDITYAGPFFRARSAPRGDGIIGAAGYWLMLGSNGTVKLLQLQAPPLVIASANVAGFDPTLHHRLIASAQATTMTVTLDGTPITFTQNGSTTQSVAVPLTGNSAAGIAFGANDNRGKIGGQRVYSLIVSRVSTAATNGPPLVPPKNSCHTDSDCGAGQQCTPSACIAPIGVKNYSCYGTCTNKPPVSVTPASCTTDTDCVIGSQCIARCSDTGVCPTTGSCYAKICGGNGFKCPLTTRCAIDDVTAARQSDGLCVPNGLTFSDSFARPNTDQPCSLGIADNALGGNASYIHYIPLFPTNGTDPTHPIGATIVDGALQNAGLDFGGAQFTTATNVCVNSFSRGTDLGQNLSMNMDILVPTDASGNITMAGPFIRGSIIARGDGIFGGSNHGYLIQLTSGGLVKVTDLAANAIIAKSESAAGFQASATHHLMIVASGAALTVTLDGAIVPMTQNAIQTTSVAIKTTDYGAAGIVFGSPDNRGKIGGQRVDNLVVATGSAATVSPILKSGPAITPPRCAILPSGHMSLCTNGQKCEATTGMCIAMSPQDYLCYNFHPCPAGYGCSLQNFSILGGDALGVSLGACQYIP